MAGGTPGLGVPGGCADTPIQLPPVLGVPWHRVTPRPGHPVAHGAPRDPHAPFPFSTGRRVPWPGAAADIAPRASGCPRCHRSHG